MRFRDFYVVLLVMSGLGGCASEPGIPDSQLSAAEISGEIRPLEAPKWVAPLTDQQAETLTEARSAWSNDDLDKARGLLEGLLDARPEHPDLLTNAGIVALAGERQDDAKTLFEETLKVAPGHRVASNNLALILKQEGDFIEASRVLRRGLQRYPGDPTLHYNLAVVYELYIQDLEKALAHYQKYQELVNEPDPKVAGWITDLERRTQ